MDETQQINLCIDEMAKLKEKMEALEKQKILNEKNEMVKKTTMEPNLKVLEDWLNNYHKTVEEKKEKINKNATEQQKMATINNIKNKISEIKDGDKKKSRLSEKRKKYYPELEKMSLSLEIDPYNVLIHKYKKIAQIRENSNYIEPPQSKEEIAASHIEATYNIFNIINKRLDDIEKKLGINS